MADTEVTGTEESGFSISNWGAGIIIALFLFLGGFIWYQNYQLNMALELAVKLSEGIQKAKK